jgi:hypothetical protein
LGPSRDELFFFFFFFFFAPSRETSFLQRLIHVPIWFMSEDFFPRCPHPFDELPSEAVRGPVEVTDGEIEFTPVPRLRRRRNG